MEMQESDEATDIYSPARVAGSLRSLLNRLAQEGPSASPVVIGRDGEPEAVLIPHAAYEALIATAVEADARELTARLASAREPGAGLSTEELIELVAGGHPDDEAEVLLTEHSRERG